MATLEESKQKVSSAMSNYTNLASGQATIAETLKQKALEAYKNNEDIVKPLDTATADYYNAPSVAREKYQDIFNPFTREKLVSQYTTNAGLPMQALSNVLGNRMGRIDDLIGSGTNAYKAQVTAAQDAVQQAQAEYDNLLKEYEINQKNAPSATSPIMAALQAILTGGGSTSTPTAPTEPEPMYSPGGNQSGIKSAGGQWTWADNKWIPTATGTTTNKSSGINTDVAKQLLSLGVLSGDIPAAAASFIGTTMGITKPSDEATSQSLVRQLNGMKSLIANTNGITAGASTLPGIGTMFSDPSFNTFKVTRDLIGQTVAKMYESGRLSDQDRVFYLRNFPTDAEVVANPKKAQQKVDSVVAYFKGSHPDWFSGSSGSDWEVMQ
jgi:hypothetical protein